MFRKTIQNIETRTGGYNQQQQASSYSGYNTQRHQRYGMNQQQKNGGSSSQFGQLKKAQQQQQDNNKSQLIIRECDVSQLNHYKKPSTTNIRSQIQQPINYYQGASYHCTPSTNTTPNSSNKKQRIQIGGLNGHNNSSRPHTYDGSYKQPLEEINFIDRENSSLSARHHLQQPQQSISSNNNNTTSTTSLTQYYDQQFQMLKQFVYQTYQQQAHTIKTLKTQVKTIQVQCMGELQNFANQISKQLNKQKEDIVTVNKRGIETQRQLRHFRDGFNEFLKDNEQKIQSIVLEMNGNMHKKSKADDQFGVELKSSSHCITGGVGTSMSMNFQTDNVSMKLYNEMSAQLEILKNQLQICKEKISLLDKDTKILQSQTKMTQQPTNLQTKPKLQLQQVEKIIIEKLSEDRKKYSISEKLQELDLKTKDLYKVYQDVDSNIKGMNAQFTRVINGTVIKKEKMIQAKLATVEERVNQMGEKLLGQAIQDTLRPILLKLLEEKSENTRFIRLRESTSMQKQKLQSVKQSQYIYMLDQQDNLLDSHGNYIVETTQSGAKQKIKIDKNLIYLLESNGVEIKSVS